ncbi:hypothetical protein [Streptomyces sp. NPDC013455]|uniref:hypothetical protein n=1 Tax=Streptomyces sp. NPDC013455 TaxID=3155605 RepID=UPI00341023D5
MAGRTERPAPAEEPEAPSPLAGGCVLLVLGGTALGGVFAASPEAGILAVWLVGVAAVWWSTRRRKGTHQPLPSPTAPPSPHDEQAGQTVVVYREGMLIYRTPDRDNPVRTHVHVELTADETHA